MMCERSRAGRRKPAIGNVLPGLVTTAVLVMLGSAAAAQLPDFSGNWRLDPDSSRITTQRGLAGFPRAAPQSLHISQSSNGTLILESGEPGGRPRVYRFNGLSRVPAPGGSGQEIEIVSQVRGSSLVTLGSGKVAGDAVNIREVLTISTFGDTLTLEVTTELPGESGTNLLVFKRAGRIPASARTIDR